MKPGATRAAVSLAGIAAVAVLACALCDLLHELGHLVTTLLPLGVEAVSISTIGISTTGSSAVVAGAGLLVNLLLSLSLLLATRSSAYPGWRYFCWLSGTVNLFNATAYLLYSAILGTGDWAVVLGAVASAALWRPAAGLAGLLCYAAAVYASVTTLRRLVESTVVSASNVARYCAISYWVGGLLLTAAAAFNPTSPWFILTSGAATGFGAMAGLLLVAPLLRQFNPPASPTGELLSITTPWIAAGILAAIIFVAVFGPGIQLE